MLKQIQVLAPISAPPGPDSFPNLAAVATAIWAMTDLSLNERQEIVSAMNTVGKVLGRPLSEIPASPSRLRCLLCDAAPPLSGVELRRWNNAISLLRRALRLVGFRPAGRKIDDVLTDEWKALLGLPGVTRQIRNRLVRLAYFGSVDGYHPSEFCNILSERFLRHLDEASLTWDPRKVHKEAVAAWNRAVDTVPGWPKTKIEIPTLKPRTVLAWAAFRPEVQDEARALLADLANPDPFDEDAPKPLAKQSLIGVDNRLRRLLTELSQIRGDAKAIASLYELGDPDIAKSVLYRIWAVYNNQRASHPFQLARSALLLGRRKYGRDTVQEKRLFKFCSKMKPDETGLTEKNKERLRQFDDRRNVNALLHLPAKLVKLAEDCETKHPTHAAYLVQKALLIEMLLMAPLRIGNMVEIRTDRHIRSSRPGYKGVVKLVIPKEIVKNKVDLEFELPSDTVKLLRLYLSKYRPRIFSAPNPYLFVTRTGRAQGKVSFSAEACKTARKLTGLILNAHLFRHIAARLFLEAHPGEYETVRRLLGQKRLETTVNYYIGFEVKSSIQRYDDEVIRLRNEPLGPVKKKFEKVAANDDNWDEI